MPIDIERMFPELWVDEDEDEGKNLNEAPLIQTILDRYRRKCKFSYNKLNDSAAGERLVQHFAQLKNFDLNVIVFNFVDILSHARTESKMIRELAYTDEAYRSLTVTWFKNSYVLEIFKRIAEQGWKIVLTTDHGTTRVDNAIKVIGDKIPTPTCATKWARTSVTTHAKCTKSNNPNASDCRCSTCRAPTSSHRAATSSPTPTTTTTTCNTTTTPSSTAASPWKKCSSPSSPSPPKITHTRS